DRIAGLFERGLELLAEGRFVLDDQDAQAACPLLGAAIAPVLARARWSLALARSSKRGLARFAEDPPGPRIDIDEHDPPVADELEPIRHRRRIVFRAEIFHPAHRRHDLALDLAERLDIAGAHFPPDRALLVRPGIGMGERGRGSERESKKGGKAAHDAAMPSLQALNKR